MLKRLKTFVLCLLVAVFPVSNTWAVFPPLAADRHQEPSEGQDPQSQSPSVNSESGLSESALNETAGKDVWGTDQAFIEVKLLQESRTETEIEQRVYENLTEEKTGFWTKKKVLLGSGLLLSAGLLLGLVALAGGGRGATHHLNGDSGANPSSAPPVFFFTGGGEGGEGGVVSSDSLPGGSIPLNPEPSTFALLGLGLLIPFLRKKEKD